MHKTRVVGPVTAAVIDFGSLMPLVAGIMDPSEAQKVLLWLDNDGGNLQVKAKAEI